MTLGPDQDPEGWSRIAPVYEQAFEGLSGRYAVEVLRLLELRPGQRVLDVAAGTGAFSLLAARAGADVLATDFAPGMIERLRRRAAAEGLANLAAEVMDGQALAVPDASFDASVSILGLIFFPDIPRGLGQLRRVLRPGGRAAVVAWSDPRRLRLMTLLVESIGKVAPEFPLPTAPPVWARLAGAEPMRAAMEAAGFTQVELSTITRSKSIESPETYWRDFSSSAPPLAYLFSQLGPERTAAVGRVYMETLVAASPDGVPTLSAEACIALGRNAGQP